MDYEAVLADSCAIPRLCGATKAEIIDEMLDWLVTKGRLPAREPARAAVLAREATMSTGMQHGVAIPHGKVAGLAGLVTAIAIKPAGADFDSLDGQPSRIFVMTISPTEQVGPHMRYLAAVSKLLDSPARREQLVACRTGEEMLLVLGERPDGGE
jgi:PTS system fructose-specific IIC component